MTKNEILYRGQKTDEQIFEMDVTQLLLELRSLAVGLSVRIYNTGIFSRAQKRKLGEFISQLDELQSNVRKWQYHGTKDQLTFSDWEIGFDKK